METCQAVAQTIEPRRNLHSLQGADPKTVLQRYLSDESTKSIAAGYGVTRQALGQFLLKHAESDWKDAQVARALARKEAAEDQLDAIGSRIQESDAEERLKLTLSLAHAREQLRSAQWDLERVCRRIYGQDAPANIQVPIQINIGIERTKITLAEAQVIDKSE